MTRLGFVTIGQAPRTDVTPHVVDRLPDDVDTVEVGALDAFETAAEAESAVGPRDGRPIFVSRMRDGSPVTVDREAAIELVQERIAELEAEVTTICLLCTGQFPEFRADVPVLEPSHLLRAWTSGIVSDGTVGVLMPKEEQFEQTVEKWGDDVDIVAVAGSPYSDADEITPAARQLGTDVDLVVMDCIGYDDRMKRIVREETGAGVLLARSVLAKTAAELL